MSTDNEVGSASEALVLFDAFIAAINARDLVKATGLQNVLRRWIVGLAEYEQGQLQAYAEGVIAELGEMSKTAHVAGYVRVADLRDRIVDATGLPGEFFDQCIVALHADKRVELLWGYDDGTRRGVRAPSGDWLNIVKLPTSLELVGGTR